MAHGIKILKTFIKKQCVIFLAFIRSLKYYRDSVGYLSERESPRLLKSHLPMELLPPDLLAKAKGKYC